MNPSATDISALILRIALGLIFIPHGFPKVFGADGPAAFASDMPQYGIPSFLGYPADRAARLRGFDSRFKTKTALANRSDCKRHELGDQGPVISSTMIPMFCAPLARAISRNLMESS